MILTDLPRMYPHNLRAYYTSAGKASIRGGLELWRGFFQYERISCWTNHFSHFLPIIIEAFALALVGCSLTWM
jgi:hypothetical protein